MAENKKDEKKAKDTGGMSFFSYSGRGDAARKKAIEEQTDEPTVTPASTTPTEPTVDDHRRGYTQEKWN